MLVYRGNIFNENHLIRAQPGEAQLMEEPKILAIGKKHNVSSAQVLIKYQIAKGQIVIPKSVTKSRIITNFDVFGFELSADEIATIDSFDRNGRLVPMSG